MRSCKFSAMLMSADLVLNKYVFLEHKLVTNTVLYQLIKRSPLFRLLHTSYRLKALTRKWPKLGIAPDRTPDEVETHRKLIKEFRRRQSSGELVQLDGDKIISVKNHNSYPPRNQSTVTSITNTQLSSDNLSLPLRVALPAINSSCKSDTLSATASVFCPSSSSISESNSSTTLQQGN